MRIMKHGVLCYQIDFKWVYAFRDHAHFPGQNITATRFFD